MSLYAKLNGQRVLATPHARATCPGCSAELLAKCGEINIWHWSHRAADCDPWHEGESAWHLKWKLLVPDTWCEVVMGPHRADIRRPDGVVIELQHSPIAPPQIAERERFYGRMIWLVDARDFADNLNLRRRDGFLSFRWKWPRKHLFSMRRDMFFDLGDRIFQVKKIHPNVPCGGWGYALSKEEFMERWFR